VDNSLKTIVSYVLRFATNAHKSALCLRTTIAKNVQTSVACVQRNAEKWQPYNLRPQITEHALLYGYDKRSSRTVS
jgi:hypothetical protein